VGQCVLVRLNIPKPAPPGAEPAAAEGGGGRPGDAAAARGSVQRGLGFRETVIRWCESVCSGLR
jgi:hypothetical protein